MRIADAEDLPLHDLYLAKDALKFEELDYYNRFSPKTQKVVSSA